VAKIRVKKTKTKDKDKVKHKRIIQSITGAVEKRVLLWFSARMPRWINPDVLSLIGVFGAVVTGVSYLLAGKHPFFLWIAALGFVINWFGDSLDGTLARYRKIERPRYGYFLDHSVDAICITFILTGLAFSGYGRLELAWGVNLIYILLALYTSLANFTSREFQISFAYIGPTELRILAIAASIFVYFNPAKLIRLPFIQMNFYEIILALLIVVFTPIYLYMTTNQILRLAKDEPPPAY
jgi:phosphatidylglycerophosphate synthase